jgi:hypothetical protein
MSSKYSRPLAQAPLEIQLLDFLYGEWGVLQCTIVGTFRREGKVVDSLIGDTTRMPNFDMIQPLGEEPLTDAECPAMMARFRPLPRPCATGSSRNQL